MASRLFTQFAYSLEKNPCYIFATASIAAAGAPTLNANLGVQSITQTGTGAYTIQLAGCSFNKLLGFQWVFGGGTASGIDAVELSQTLAVQKTDINAGIVRIQCYFGGVATDPASGSVLQFTVVGRNSSTGPA